MGFVLSQSTKQSLLLFKKETCNTGFILHCFTADFYNAVFVMVVVFLCVCILSLLSKGWNDLGLFLIKLLYITSRYYLFTVLHCQLNTPLFFIWRVLCLTIYLYIFCVCLLSSCPTVWPRVRQHIRTALGNCRSTCASWLCFFANSDCCTSAV